MFCIDKRYSGLAASYISANPGHSEEALTILAQQNGVAADWLRSIGSPLSAAIPGLFAAGECAYVGTNGANPMTVDVVFGGIAGENAAAYVAK